MLRIGLAGVLGGIVLFIWSFISWAVIGWHNTAGGVLPDEGAVVASLEATIPESAPHGLYWIPGIDPADMEDAAATADWEQRHRQGPIGVLIYRPQGAEPMPPVVFGRGFALDVVSAGIVACLLAVTALCSYAGRVAFVTMLGLFIGVYGDLLGWNYMWFPLDHTLVNVADNIVAWLLAGLVIGAIVKGRGAACAVPAA